MDELDQLILQTLQEDGRTPFTQIAEQAGVSETTIRSRYRSLEKAGIVRIVGVVDPFALGFQAPAIVGVSVDADKIDQVAAKIAEFPEVSYLVMTLGSSDLTIEVFCRDLLSERFYGSLQPVFPAEQSISIPPSSPGFGSVSQVLARNFAKGRVQRGVNRTVKMIEQ